MLSRAQLIEKYGNEQLAGQPYAEEFARFLVGELTGDQLVIDIGCGNGDDVATLSKQTGMTVIGVDASRDTICLARGRHPRLDFAIATVATLPLDDASVSAVYCVNTMTYVDQAAAMKEIMRVLRPGGFLFVHFDQSITDDASGTIDFKQVFATDILPLIHPMKSCGSTKFFDRVDEQPFRHTHKIRQDIRQKRA